jgi:hypothetical protein
LSTGADSREGVTCRHCGDVIGVYEPMVLLHDGEALLTSRAAVDEALVHDAPRYHESCFCARRGRGASGCPTEQGFAIQERAGD